MQCLGLSHRPTFLYDYLKPAIQTGFVAMTESDSVGSPTQKYRLTEKGYPEREGEQQPNGGDDDARLYQCRGGTLDDIDAASVPLSCRNGHHRREAGRLRQ